MLRIVGSREVQKADTEGIGFWGNCCALVFESVVIVKVEMIMRWYLKVERSSAAITADIALSSENMR